MIGPDAISELSAAIKRTSARPFPLAMLLPDEPAALTNADVSRFARSAFQARAASAGTTSAAVGAAAMRTRAAAMRTMATGMPVVPGRPCANKPSCKCGGCC